MITPELLNAALRLSFMGPSQPATALIAVHLANLPPEPETWGVEPKTTMQHMTAAAIEASRTLKLAGWKVPDPMAIALLATAEVGSAHAAWTRTVAAMWAEARRRRETETANKPAGIAARSLAQMRVAAEVYAAPGDPALTEDEDRAARHAEYMTRCAGLDDAAVVDKVGYEMGRVDLVTHMVRERERAEHKLRDLAGVATVATEEPEAAPVVHTHECYTRSAMAEHWQCDCSGTLAIYSNTSEPVDPAIYAAAMTPILDEVERVARETPPIVVEVRPEHAMSVTVEEFPTAAESRGMAHAIIDVILASHGLETGPDGAVVRKLGAPAVDTTVPDETLTAAPPLVGHVVDVAVEDPDFSPTGPAADEPKPKKPRCGLGYGWYETEPARPMLCGRPEGHKGACGPAKVVGKAKAAEVGS